jgi:hypothetical protein
MTETLGYKMYAAGGCDIGGIVSSQLGHKYADELYGIHIGSGLPLDFFTGPRAWDRWVTTPACGSPMPAWPSSARCEALSTQTWRAGSTASPLRTWKQRGMD